MLSVGKRHKCFLPPVIGSHMEPVSWELHKDPQSRLSLTQAAVTCGITDTRGGTQSIREGGDHREWNHSAEDGRRTGEREKEHSILHRPHKCSAGSRREQNRTVSALAFQALNHCSPHRELGRRLHCSGQRREGLSQIHLIIAGV